MSLKRLKHKKCNCQKFEFPALFSLLFFCQKFREIIISEMKQTTINEWEIQIITYSYILCALDF